MVVLEPNQGNPRVAAHLSKNCATVRPVRYSLATVPFQFQGFQKDSFGSQMVFDLSLKADSRNLSLKAIGPIFHTEAYHNSSPTPAFKASSFHNRWSMPGVFELDFAWHASALPGLQSRAPHG